jgi:hypothetical protein
MHAPIQEKHTPDPKCCCRGLRPRSPRGSDKGSDVVRLLVVLALLLPVFLTLSSFEA